MKEVVFRFLCSTDFWEVSEPDSESIDHVLVCVPLFATSVPGLNVAQQEK